MDRNFFRIHDVGIKELLIVGLVLLGGYTVWLHRQLVEVAYRKVSDKVEASVPWRPTVVDTCSTNCQKEIDKKVAQALATASVQKSSGSSKTTTGTTKTSSVSIGSTFSTTNTDWTDVPGSVYVDPSGYGSSQDFSWTVSLKIANGNGQAIARLYDGTNNIAVSGSEVSVSSSDYTAASSGSLPFWAGNNLYKVQIKSTTSQAVSVTSATIKVVYK